jgi:ABC-type tungstate transport system permease subunit
MKTAMQELILKLPNEFIADNPSIILELLKKEKEHMLNFYMWMRMNENTEKYLDYTDEDMFNEYLKQGE